MTSVHPALRVRVLEDRDRAELLAFLETERVASLYLRSLVHEYGVTWRDRIEHGRFFGTWRSDRLAATAFLGNARNICTMGDPASVTAALDGAMQGQSLPRLFVGPAEHADLVRRCFNQRGVSPHLDRPQGYYVLTPETLRTFPRIGIASGKPEDLDAITSAHAAMTEEDLSIPRTSLDMQRLRRATLGRLEEKKIWVVMEGDKLLCKMEESARSDDGILVGGVYTESESRNQGLATRALAAWAGMLFDEGISMLALHVNVVNVPAIRAYENVGFRRHSMLRLMLAY